MTTVERFQEWLDSPQYKPTIVEPKPRLNRQIFSWDSRNSPRLVFDAIEAMNSEDGTMREP